MHRKKFAVTEWKEVSQTEIKADECESTVDTSLSVLTVEDQIVFLFAVNLTP